MKQKRLIVILGAAGIIFVVIWVTAAILLVNKVLGSKQSNDLVVVNLALCDEDASDLCVVSFGANSLNLMVINFQLPDENYAAFYVKGTNRGDVNLYSCEVSKATPTSVYCSGIRTPLGETIDIEVYTTADDALIARGTFLVSAVALFTPIILPTLTPAITLTPSGEVAPTPFPAPTKAQSTPIPTVTAYPNP